MRDPEIQVLKIVPKHEEIKPERGGNNGKRNVESGNDGTSGEGKRSRVRRRQSKLEMAHSINDLSTNRFNSNVEEYSLCGADRSAKLPAVAGLYNHQESSAWGTSSRILTFCCFPFLLNLFGIRGENVQQAWREKVTLCLIIGLFMTFVAYFTVGMRAQLCNQADMMNMVPYYQSDGSVPYRDEVLIAGYTYRFDDVKKVLASQVPPINLTSDWYNRDISKLFDLSDGACNNYMANATTFCSVSNRFALSPNLTANPCLSGSLLESIQPTSMLVLDWSDLEKHDQLFVYNSRMMDLKSFFSFEQSKDYRNVPNLSKMTVGSDVTLAMNSDTDTAVFSRCLTSRYTIGLLGSTSVGCSASTILMLIALVVVLLLILIRFFMALIFHWIIAPRMASPSKEGLEKKYAGVYLAKPSNGPLYKQGWQRSIATPSDLYTICMVTCYSEDETAIKGTLDSIAGTDYPDERKLLFVICDGLIHGAGNAKFTPDIVISLMTQDPRISGVPEPVSYLANADGVKQHNMAKVYAGHYFYRQKPVPIIVIVKCGTEEERRASSSKELAKKKAGNRGKRDSQLILMHFLSRVTFNDIMTALDYDIFWKIQHITGGITADKYELLLMVDADTVVNQSSLRYMVQTMVNDPKVMGLCGETRVSNKTQSWVTMIQVYEYFTSHNLGKAFESAFGGTTCLPGCFCMYRIKSQKGKEFIPLLVNPDVVACYSENVVDSLHKKNLLLLGEDRFLSTLMLGTFPRRSMVFVPQAICHTTVPHTYKILQSQRRRWINSTIHNLLELVLLPTLCGTFCLSMQFVIALELVGTVSLPMAVVLTFYLIIQSIVTGSNNLLPLMLLLVTLFLPGVLVVITTKKPVYVLWMFVYLLSLPVWNFLLPLYAFWHFDDFSWGDTRKIQGEIKQADHSNKNGDYQIGSVPLKRWEEWELIRKMQKSLPPVPPLDSNPNSNPNSNPTHSTRTKNQRTDQPGSLLLDKRHIAEVKPVEKSKGNAKISKPKTVAPILPFIADVGNFDLIPPSWDTRTPNDSIPKSSFNNNFLNVKESPNVPSDIPIRKPSLSSATKSTDLSNIPAIVNLPTLSTMKNSSTAHPQAMKNLDLATTSKKGSLSSRNASKAKKAEVSKPAEVKKETSSTTINQSINSVHSNLPMKAGNTINQLWKSMYKEQMEELSLQSMEYQGLDGSKKISTGGCGIVDSESFRDSNMHRHSQVSSVNDNIVLVDRMAKSSATTPSLVKHSASVVEKRRRTNPDTKSTARKSLDNPIVSMEQLVEKVQTEGLSRQTTVDSIASYATARPFQDSLAELDMHSRETFSSSRSSVILGPRPFPGGEYPVEKLGIDVEKSLDLDASLGDFKSKIEREAKTSTTTKAFQFMFGKQEKVEEVTSRKAAMSYDDPLGSYLEESREIINSGLDRRGASRVRGARSDLSRTESRSGPGGSRPMN